MARLGGTEKNIVISIGGTVGTVLDNLIYCFNLISFIKKKSKNYIE